MNNETEIVRVKTQTNFAWLCNQCDMWNYGSTKREIEGNSRIGLDCKHKCKKRIEIVYKGTWKVHHVFFPYRGDAARYCVEKNSRENPVGNIDDPFEGWE